MSNTSRARAVLFALAASSPAQVWAQLAAPSPQLISARQHDADLAAAESALRQQENRRERTLQALRALEKPRLVSRPDGASMLVGGDVWQSRRFESTSVLGGDYRRTVSRGEVRQAGEAVRAHRRALQEWAFPPSGKYLEADAGAKAALLGWAQSKVIETGPPQWQQPWLSFVRWAHSVLERLMNWLNSLMRRAPGASPQGIDGDKIKLFFYVILAAVLAGAVWLTWKALGGRLPRARKARRDTALEGEDAALLRLPPEELLHRAQQFAQAGNFREALRHRYLSLLLQLEARGVWRYDRKRTNWEHIARLKTAGTARSGIDAISDLTLRFDRVRYGNESCDASGWASFESQAEATLERLSRGANATPAEAAR